jgi:hypothetical protein
VIDSFAWLPGGKTIAFRFNLSLFLSLCTARY